MTLKTPKIKGITREQAKYLCSHDGLFTTDENTPLHPKDITIPYKHSKYLAEIEALRMLERGLPLVVVNPSTPIGPYDIKPTPTGKIIVDFLNGRMPAYIDTGLNIVHVKDVAKGHVLAAQKGRIGERYILGNKNMSLKEILGALSKIAGVPAPKVRIPYRIALIVGYLSSFVSDYLTHHPLLVPLEGVEMAHKKMFLDRLRPLKNWGYLRHPSGKPLWKLLSGFRPKDM